MTAPAVQSAIPQPSAAHAATVTGVVACFVLSGFSALLYQTAWLRQFSLVFGTSELAVAAVLAAYMGGLAAGATIAGRLISKVSKPLFVYGALEGGIALSALTVPLLVEWAGALYAGLLGDLPVPPNAATIGQPVFYLAVAFVVLALPAGLMGATLPVLTRYAVRHDLEVGPKVALLYASNTVGAVLGTVVAAFVLLPALGLTATVWVGVALNGLVFLIAAHLARSNEPIAGQAESSGAPYENFAGFFARCVQPLAASSAPLGRRFRQVFQQQPGWMLPLMLASGANAFFYEVLWTRMLAHVLGGSIYAFATMLAAFLSGIALGGGLGGGVARDKMGAAVAFAAAQVGVALCSIAVYGWMQTLIPEVRSTVQLSAYAVIVMLPATVFLGATLPLAVRVLAGDEREASPATALVYAWNTVGAVVGALLAGLLAIPHLGFEGSIKFAVLVNLAIALWTASCVLPFRALVTAAAAGALTIAAVVYDPKRPRALLESTALPMPLRGDARELYFAVGRSSTVLLLERDGALELRTNGLPEASAVVKGGAPLGQAQHWLVALPLAARADAEHVLMIGLGAAVALEGLPASINSVDVIELEPEVVEANRRASARRLVDPLEDPRIDIAINDARNALTLTSKRYDIIVSQPSHPWTAGASHLYTREFLELSKTHLEPDGVFVQWMSGSFVDGPLLRSVTATLLDAFRNVRLYRASAGVLLFLGSDSPLDVELRIARTGEPLAANAVHYGYMGLNGVEDFVAALLLDERGAERFAADAPTITDDMNRMATHSRWLGDGLNSEDLRELLAPHDPLLESQGWVHRSFGERLNYGYLARRLVAEGEVERAQALSLFVQDASARSLVTALLSAYAGALDAARDSFAAALRADAGNADARFALVAPELPAFARGEASERAKAWAAGLPPPAAAVVSGWRLAAAGDWQGLAALDPVLERAVVTDLWFPEATQLRAQWRIRATENAGYPAEALRMIDRALLIRPSLDLYLLRAAAADALGDADTFVETARYAAVHASDAVAAARADSDAHISNTELSLMRRRLEQLQSGLPPTLGASEDRLLEVRQRLEDALQEVHASILGR